VRAGTVTSGKEGPRTPASPTQVFDSDYIDEADSREVLPLRTGLQVQKMPSREGHDDDGVSSQFPSLNFF